jgi:hypothetical protein
MQQNTDRWPLHSAVHPESLFDAVKGQQRGIFLSKVISPKVPQSVLNKDLNSLRYSTIKVLLRYGLLWQICYELWATSTNLVMCFGPLRWIWLCSKGQCMEWCHTIKIFDDFHTMCHSTGFDYALWAMVQDLVMCYGPYTVQCRTTQLYFQSLPYLL